MQITGWAISDHHVIKPNSNGRLKQFYNLSLLTRDDGFVLQ